MTSDLEGFWEIIEIQVKHVQKKFIYLEKCKLNNYVRVSKEEEEPVVSNLEAKKPVAFKLAKAIIANQEEKEANSHQAPPKKKLPFASFRANLKFIKHNEQSTETQAQSISKSPIKSNLFEE